MPKPDRDALKRALEAMLPENIVHMVRNGDLGMEEVEDIIETRWALHKSLYYEERKRTNNGPIQAM